MKIRVTFNEFWYKRVEEQEKPQLCVMNALKKAFDDYVDSYRNENYCEVTFRGRQDIDKVRGIFEETMVKNLLVSTACGSCEVTVLDESGETIGSGGKIENDDLPPLNDDNGQRPATLDELSALDDIVNDFTSSSAASGSTSSDTSVSVKALEKAKKLVGCDEFIKLLEEISLISTQVKKNDSYETFYNQSYLFSIGDGCGFTTATRIFGDLLHETGLDKGCGVNRYETNKLDDAADDIERNSLNLVCFDITSIMGDMRKPETREKLRRLVTGYDPDVFNVIFIFRIPKVSEDTLCDVMDVLNDITVARCVEFNQLDQESIRKHAGIKLADYGYSANDESWDNFFKRITEEKSDSKFYGFKTINKVINELVYKKQLTNAINGTDDKSITELDTRKIVLGESADREMTGQEMFDSLIGVDPIKKRIEEIIAQIEYAKLNGQKMPCMHMRFVGSPGTGKTTIARVIGKLLKEKGILRVGDFFEYAGRDFCGRYIGETAPKTMGICRDAYGSVLFIDEAYSLYKGTDDTKDYGREAIDTLIAEMENHRSDLVVIMAGYKEEMDTLLKANPGLASRMPYTIEFDNYSREQLCKIFMGFFNDKIEIEGGFEEQVKKYFDALDDEYLAAKEFSNARFARNLFERVCLKAITREKLNAKPATKLYVTKLDFESASSDGEFDLNNKKKKSHVIGFI